MYDVAVIGAGIVGSFIARELSKYNISIAILEKNSDVCNGTTGSNCCNVYEAFRQPLGSENQKLIIRGNEIYDEICEELDVPFKRIGSLTVGFDEEDRKKVENMYAKALESNAKGVRIVNREELAELEPNIDEKFQFGFYSSTCGAIWPFQMSVALVENAMDNGAELFLNSEVNNIEKQHSSFKITTKGRDIEAKCVINCAGVYADKINNMLAEKTKFNIAPKKAQFLVFNNNIGPFFNHVLNRCPKEGDRGLNVLPTAGGNIMMGPVFQATDDRESPDTSFDQIELLKKKMSRLSDKIPFNKVIRCFAGLTAKEENGRVIIGESEEVKGFINAASVDQGVTCAPAIAEKIAEIVHNIFKRDYDTIRLKSNFNPKRRRAYRFKELNDSEKEELIRKDSKYGRVICRCEMVTEGEIVDAIRRNCGATTVKGVKNRTKALMGECQGGFCEPKIVQILARELGKDMSDIKYGNEDSYILVKNSEG
ncbi:NAD(P)/FAD-dependent oxidoreductase [Clostridium sp.]|jgi:glycerol-3-phosphate dehydrogenase|uniref:NAD(P)/FAD-dependent oxidoreductase n=1 Tax=Clostridium sp. TaxID=1506 RepID=UPI002585FBE8|nr:NAD(P)/FAD-dependent oxidoreductase [Clostridium sp.]MDF2505951.1 putative dehydrogenase [Clostridium sp.]